ncbi:MAG: zinc-binding dehydrogenase [Bacteroidota bacterium]
MKSLRTIDPSGSIALQEIDRPTPSPGQCLIQLRCAALNRRDQWIREGLYPGIKAGVTLGSDGCGVVVEGPEEWVGKEVIINPSLDWGNDPAAQGPDYSILGLPVDGTLAEYMVIGTDQLVEKPAHLTTSEAAAIPLAALTAYRACVTKAQIVAGNRVLVGGAGGGVSQFALSIAKSLGAEVYVTSSSEEKVARSVAQGASGGFDYRDASWTKQALGSAGAFDVVIDGAAGPNIDSYLQVIKPGGRIVVYGATAGKPKELDVRRLFWSQVAIHGSTMGSPEEFKEMVNLFDSKQIRPVIDQMYRLGDGLQAFDRFKASDHFGKIVIEIS